MTTTTEATLRALAGLAATVLLASAPAAGPPR